MTTGMSGLIAFVPAGSSPRMDDERLAQALAHANALETAFAALDAAPPTDPQPEETP